MGITAVQPVALDDDELLSGRQNGGNSLTEISNLHFQVEIIDDLSASEPRISLKTDLVAILIGTDGQAQRDLLLDALGGAKLHKISFSIHLAA